MRAPIIFRFTTASVALTTQCKGQSHTSGWSGKADHPWGIGQTGRLSMETRQNPRLHAPEGKGYGKAEIHGWSILGSIADLGTKEVIQADLNNKVRLRYALEQGEAHVPAWRFVVGNDCITGKGLVTDIKAR